MQECVQWLGKCELCDNHMQVDVTAAEATAAAAAAPGVPPAPTPDVAASTQMVGMAVKQLTAGWSVTGDVWAGIAAGVARLKPHKAHDQGSQALRSVEQRAGRLALSHFRRVKQLGTGDVGLVDLVELQQGGSRCALPG